MDRFEITGGYPLVGEVIISGAKNSALPSLAACLLTRERVRLRRIPRVRDIRTMEQLLAYAGARVDVQDDFVDICAADLPRPEAPYDVVKTMRASSLVLGPLVARTGMAKVSMPGGCAIGTRPIDLHVSALEQLGAKIRLEEGYISAEAPQGLQGTHFRFDRITVTGTEDLMMAATLARGETVIENAAREPEVQDLASLLIKMGARIEGAGTSTIRITGVASLQGADHTIIPDRIEAGTFLVGAAMTRGDLKIERCCPEHLEALVTKMREAGADIVETGSDSLRVTASRRLKAVDVATQEYPGFATDLQAQYMAAMTEAEGICSITETIFENRFMHVQELARMGASISIDGRKAVVTGVGRLTGAQVIASDLRASASLVLAALVGKGKTVIDRVYHIDRGYEKIEEKLALVGAQIERTE